MGGKGFPGRGNNMSKGPEGAPQIPETGKRQACWTLETSLTWDEAGGGQSSDLMEASRPRERAGSLILRPACAVELDTNRKR